MARSKRFPQPPQDDDFTLPGFDLGITGGMELPEFDLGFAPDVPPEEAGLTAQHDALREHVDHRLQNEKALHERVEFGYWFPVVFVTRPQADAFIEAAGLTDAIEHNEFGFYLNGLTLAALMGITLTPHLATYKAFPKDERLIAALGLQETLAQVKKRP